MISDTIPMMIDSNFHIRVKWTSLTVSDTVGVTTAKSDYSVDGMYDTIESNDVSVNDCGVVCHSDNLDDAVARFFIFLATGLIRTLL
jgi:hypothetical protein